VKRNLFLKILFSYLVVICLSFFILHLLVREHISKVMISGIEQELIHYAELVDLNTPQTMSANLRESAKYPSPA